MFIFVGCGSTLVASSTDNAPTGFMWQTVPDTSERVLKPSGWFFKKEVRSDTLAYFVTKEDIAARGRLDTGLTVNVHKNIPKKTGVTPSVYATALINQAARVQPLKKRWQERRGSLQGFGYMFVDRKSGEPDVIVRHLLVANDKTGTLHSLIFEAPSARWEEEWKLGEVMLSRIVLDEAM